MPSDDLATLGEELAAFGRRIEELRAARGLPADQLKPAFDAALVELDEAVRRLWPLHHALAERPGGVGGAKRDTQMLRAMFQEFPLPVVLLDRDAVIRRLNSRTAELIGVGHGYATGRPLTGFVAPAYRAAFRSHVSAVARTGEPRSLVVETVSGNGAGERLQVTLVALRPSGEARNTVLAVMQSSGRLPALRPQKAPETARTQGRRRAPDIDVRRETVHLDLIDAMTTALLSPASADASGALRQAAEVLHRHGADWVIGDLLDESGMRRQVVLGPQDPAADDLAACLAKQAPDDCPLVMTATATAAASVRVNPEDLEAFGRDQEGAAILTRAQVTSLVCLPLCSAPPNTGASTRPVRGVLTLFRTEGREPFALGEVAVLDRISRHIALRLERGHHGNDGA